MKKPVAAAGLAGRRGEDAPGAAAVVVSGHREFDYAELSPRTAPSAGARCSDQPRPPCRCPTASWPGTGATLAAIETASGERAETGGKPEPHLFEQARAVIRAPSGWRWSATGSPPTSRAVARAGLTTILVLSGTTAGAAERRRRPTTSSTTSRRC